MEAPTPIPTFADELIPEELSLTVEFVAICVGNDENPRGGAGVTKDATVDTDVVATVAVEVIDVDDKIEEGAASRVSAIWTPSPSSQQVVFAPPQHTVPSAHCVIKTSVVEYTSGGFVELSGKKQEVSMKTGIEHNGHVEFWQTSFIPWPIMQRCKHSGLVQVGSVQLSLQSCAVVPVP